MQKPVEEQPIRRQWALVKEMLKRQLVLDKGWTDMLHKGIKFKIFKKL